jgi:hypothetical protein
MITENDPAGMGIAFSRAINRVSEHQCRLVTTATRYNFCFQKDLHVPDLNEEGLDEIRQLLHEADIIHFHILADENLPLGPINVGDFILRKRVVHHHHGHPDFRTNPEKYRWKYRRRGRKALVSTPDLLHMLPEAHWQPNLVPIHDPLYMPISANGNGSVRVCHSPTRKDLKNTDEFKLVMSSVQSKHRNVECVVVENTRHEICLKIKQSSDIHFDHMQGYFGVSSLEGLSQGKPVIAGVDEWNLKCLKDFTGADELPWIVARDQEQLKQKLIQLVCSAQLRLEVGTRSRNLMERHWNEHVVLAELFRLYDKL